MHRLLSFVVLLISTGQVFSQENRDYIWQLGQRTYNDTIPYSLVFDFRNSSLLVDLIFRDFRIRLTNASICDTQGELIAYTNGCAVVGHDHEILPNGDRLNPGIAYDVQCGDENGGYVVADGAQFINFGDSLIHLFHQNTDYLSNPVRVIVDRLYVTTLRRGKAGYFVESKNESLVLDTLTGGQLECIRGLSNDWWCIASRRFDNTYYTLNASIGGIDVVNTQVIGDKTISGGDGGGQAVFSPDGTQYARYTPADQVFLFDFDRENGLLGNYRYVHVSDSGFIGGLAFSPSSRYLYVSSQFDLYQVDSWAEDIQSSVTHIAHYDGFFSPFPATFYLMQLGPDCRIYMIPPNGIDVMHVIHDPDLPGAACNFEQHGIQLPANNTITLPNFPNYRLGIGPPCDPTITGLAEALPKPEPVRIGPNPATDYLNVWTDIGEARLMLFDLQGHMVFSREIDGMGLQTVEFDLPSGMYVYCIVSQQGERFSGKLLVQHE